MEVGDIKHLAAKFHDKYLTDKDDDGDEKEASTLAETSKCRLACHEGLGIEHIPELEHHKQSEEQTQLVRTQTIVATIFKRKQIFHRGDVGMLHDKQYNQQENGEESSHANDVPCHASR